MTNLPSSWSLVTLGQLAKKLVDGSHNPPPKKERGHPMLSARNIVGGQILFDDYRLINEADFTVEHRRTHIEPGDVLLTIVGAIGRAAVVPRNLQAFTLQRSVAVIGLQPAVDANYLAHALHSPSIQQWLNDNAKGTAQKGIYLKKLGSAQLPLAPRLEQSRIVAKIDSLSGKSKRARESLDHIPRLVNRYKQAVLAAAFRGALTADWRQKSKARISGADIDAARRAAWQLGQRGQKKAKYVEPLAYEWSPEEGDLPDGWVLASVDQVSSLVQYGTSAKTNEDSSGVAILRMGNIQDGRLDLSSLKYLPANHDEFPELLLQPGDLLFNRTNSAELVGKCAVFTGQPQKASFASYLIRVRCCGLLPELLSGYINSAIGREWVASVVAQQVGQANVNGTKLRQLGVPVMPVLEQKELARRIERAFTWIDRLAVEATSARKLIDRLDQAILAKAFRGELVPQDPNDEPASVLLERIKAARPAAVKSTKRKGQ